MNARSETMNMKEWGEVRWGRQNEWKMNEKKKPNASIPWAKLNEYQTTLLP